MWRERSKENESVICGWTCNSVEKVGVEGKLIRSGMKFCFLVKSESKNYITEQ